MCASGQADRRDSSWSTVAGLISVTHSQPKRKRKGKRKPLCGASRRFAVCRGRPVVHIWLSLVSEPTACTQKDGPYRSPFYTRQPTKSCSAPMAVPRVYGTKEQTVPHYYAHRQRYYTSRVCTKKTKKKKRQFRGNAGPRIKEKSPIKGSKNA